MADGGRRQLSVAAIWGARKKISSQVNNFCGTLLVVGAVVAATASTALIGLLPPLLELRSLRRRACIRQPASRRPGAGRCASTPSTGDRLGPGEPRSPSHPLAAG